MASNLAELVGVGTSSAEASHELASYMDNIVKFFNTYRDKKGGGGGEMGLVKFPASADDYRVSFVGQARDIEEMVCSTRYCMYVCMCVYVCV